MSPAPVPPMPPGPAAAEHAREVVLGYHQRTKHHLQRYAAGPETLDWDAQPDPFRRYGGAPLTLLPLAGDGPTPPWSALKRPAGVAPRPLTRETIALLLELSFGLTAWKQYGPDRWALRANPSSGNLHPTEAWLVVRGAQALADGLYHYAPREHALEQRLAAAPDAPHPGLWVALSSIQWREAWKYGERAFRYCQLDAGHALGALRYAAAVLGWRLRVVDGAGSERLAALLGLDRDADYPGGAEREEPELLIEVRTEPDGEAALPAVPAPWPQDACWLGQASRLDRRPMYRWPVIDEVARATRGGATSDAETAAAAPVAAPAAIASERAPSIGLSPDLPAATLIRQRRSAQAFDRRAVMGAPAFWSILQALLPHAPDAIDLPWDAWPRAQREPRVHPVLYVHRVEGLPGGAYALPRSAGGEALLRRSLHAVQGWSRAPEAPADVPLWKLADHPALAGTLRTLSCHQAIGSDACFAVSLIAEFAAPVQADPAQYRALYQEAGLIGQVLYMEAEAQGYRGTGIGCYFDDAVHEFLGIEGQAVQVLYHFTVGVPVSDARIQTEPPYAHLPERERIR